MPLSSRLEARHISGIFYAFTYKLTAAISISLGLYGDTVISFATGYDSRFSVYQAKLITV